MLSPTKEIKIQFMYHNKPAIWIEDSQHINILVQNKKIKSIQKK